MSKGNGWVPIDKMLAQDFKYIKRPLSRMEAMFSYTVDIDNGIEGTIAGYATQWGWSRNKVRRFVNCIRTDEGHLRDSKRTHEGHPIHFIDNGFDSKKDTSGTGKGQVADTCHDTTNKTKTKTKELYSSNFLKFWESYPKKVGKGTAFKAYKNIKEPRPSLSLILQSIEQHTESGQWNDSQFIPHPSTWLNGRHWENEFDGLNGTKKSKEQILKEAGLSA